MSNVVGTKHTPAIHLADESGSFDGILVQSYLARGIAVIGTMNTVETTSSQRDL